MKNKPLKRIKELKPFSKDHHHGLLLGWKIRTGLKKGVDITQICQYVRWFYENHLIPHFELEEKYIFPILEHHEFTKKACEDHRQMHSIMTRLCDEDSLLALAELLEKHIRFEERELFQQIQIVATQTQLELIDKIHDDGDFTEYHDAFWTAM